MNTTLKLTFALAMMASTGIFAQKTNTAASQPANGSATTVSGTSSTNVKAAKQEEPKKENMAIQNKAASQSNTKKTDTTKTGGSNLAIKEAIQKTIENKPGLYHTHIKGYLTKVCSEYNDAVFQNN